MTKAPGVNAAGDFACMPSHLNTYYLSNYISSMVRYHGRLLVQPPSYVTGPRPGSFKAAEQIQVIIMDTLPGLATAGFKSSSIFVWSSPICMKCDYGGAIA